MVFYSTVFWLPVTWLVKVSSGAPCKFLWMHLVTTIFWFPGLQTQKSNRKIWSKSCRKSSLLYFSYSVILWIIAVSLKTPHFQQNIKPQKLHWAVHNLSCFKWILQHINQLDTDYTLLCLYSNKHIYNTNQLFTPLSKYCNLEATLFIKSPRYIKWLYLI